ncbi:lasso peptide biosynthesis B2 protein [Asticcacaulis sp. DXS10W]|uniref:Lasso peptide biosynthesis B2 protein n=1 Tax=Asticcacaulis currens TaxID=2984210 RepID=A0ABT5I9C7_9CAUL|nr:lasso peptide biosynthesis B2 protein [Asticcacaulis currens]MDC7692777.1 lasso peptide biosynthesis B2 protein [Asticcacaulis currens]
MKPGLFSYTKYFLLNLFFRSQVILKRYRDFRALSLSASGTPAPVSTARWIGTLTYKTSLPIPGANCLSRALTAIFILKRKGYEARMEIGVRPKDETFLAHAFVYSGTNIIVGNENGEIKEFTFLSDLRSSST